MDSLPAFNGIVHSKMEVAVHLPLHDLLTNECHQNESFSPSINILWTENLHLCNIEIHKWDVFNFKPLLSAIWAIYAVLFSVKKERCFVWTRREIWPDQAPFTSENWPKQLSTNMLVDLDVRGQQGISFFNGGSVIMDYKLVFWPEVMVCLWQKLIFSFHKTLFDHLWITVMFLSAVRTAVLMAQSLQRIHLWANYVMLNFSKSVKDEETNSSIL